MNPDEGLANFTKIWEIWKDKVNILNEADTRAKVIDGILTDCLGWNEFYIRRETKNAEGYTDYELCIKDLCYIVIEAKKGGDYFSIPETFESRQYKIDGVIATVPNLKAAIEQVRSYCSDIGCKFAAVTNGYQFVAFTAVTYGKSWRTGHCIVFHSLEDIKNNFSYFWKMLAYESVSKGSLISFLEKAKRDLSFSKIMSSIHNPDLCWARNDLYTFIQPISDLVFSELLDEAHSEILKECYVFGRTNSPLVDRMESYFSDKLPHFAQRYKIRDIFENQNKAGIFQKEYQKIISDKTKGSLMVLVGGIGCGKSTFLSRFFQIVMSSHEALLVI